MHLLASRKALKSLTVPSAPRDQQQASAKRALDCSSSAFTEVTRNTGLPPPLWSWYLGAIWHADPGTKVLILLPNKTTHSSQPVALSQWTFCVCVLVSCVYRKWQPTPVLLPGESHGWRSLVGYSPWGHKQSDMTEWLSTHIFYYT